MLGSIINYSILNVYVWLWVEVSACDRLLSTCPDITVERTRLRVDTPLSGCRAVCTERRDLAMYRSRAAISAPSSKKNTVRLTNRDQLFFDVCNLQDRDVFALSAAVVFDTPVTLAPPVVVASG